MKENEAGKAVADSTPKAQRGLGVCAENRIPCLRVGYTERSAGFQPAVSRVSNPPATWQSIELRTVCRLEVGDTAGWKPALRGWRLTFPLN